MVIETGAIIVLAFLTAAMGVFAYVEKLQQTIQKLEARMVRYETFIITQTKNQAVDSHADR